MHRRATKRVPHRRLYVCGTVLLIALVTLAPLAGAYFCWGINCNVLPEMCCSGHGMCVGTDVCECFPGWWGQECEKEVPLACMAWESTAVCSVKCVPYDGPQDIESYGTCVNRATGDADPDGCNDDSNICACRQGFTGPCCTDYRPATLTPSAVDFGGVTVGATGTADSPVVLSNTMGTTNLTVTTITLTGPAHSDFSYTTTCAAGTNLSWTPGNCAFDLTFTPSAAGTRTATLTVNATDPYHTDQFQIMDTTLEGTGITSVSSILVDPLLPTTVLAGLKGAGIYRSTNSGGSWAAASLSPANLQVTALVKQQGAGSTTYYAGTIGGVYTSTDGGANWAVCTNTGLADTNVHALAADSSGTLYAGTESGVFASTDNCASWTAMNEGLP